MKNVKLLFPMLLMLCAFYLVSGDRPQKTRYDYYYYLVFKKDGSAVKAYSCDVTILGVTVNEQGKILHLKPEEIDRLEFVGKSKYLN